jgi:hypothetical protein
MVVASHFGMQIALNEGKRARRNEDTKAPRHEGAQALASEAFWRESNGRLPTFSVDTAKTEN